MSLKLLGARTLLVAPGLTARSKKLLETVHSSVRPSGVSANLADLRAWPIRFC